MKIFECKETADKILSCALRYSIEAFERLGAVGFVTKKSIDKAAMRGADWGTATKCSCYVNTVAMNVVMVQEL